MSLADDNQAARWKKIAKRPLTGNPMVDAVLIDDLQAALMPACERIADLEGQLAMVYAQKKFWEEEAEKLRKKIQPGDRVQPRDGVQLRDGVQTNRKRLYYAP